jgi:alpha-glucosidase
MGESMSQFEWWQTAIFYQIYPRSFADGNGDGIGDFPGIISKLDYLKTLGVDGLWLSPFFPSPNWDCGYDVADYMSVAPEYGTFDDFRGFLDGAHARGMRVVIDLVLNHTSDEHAWFLESKSSRDNAKADWYIWHDPTPIPGGNPEGGPPNNWQSCFDGPAWTYVKERNQYYYHYFMRQQPDLNWHNPKVKKRMWAAARFWLDLGVDGFRLDALGTIFEDPNMTPHNVPLNLAGLRHFSDTAQTAEEKKLLDQYWHDMFKNQWGGPGLHDLIKELRIILDEYPGSRMLVGEDDNIDYLGNGGDELHLVFNFPLMRTTQITPAHVRSNQSERLHRLDALPIRGWDSNTLGNHDCSRLISRYGDGLHDEQLARLHFALIMTMRGTPFLYNGEEIGMSDLIILEPEKLRDTMAIWYYNRQVNELGIEPALAAQRTGVMSRDKNRTPMQWQNAPHGGFCPQDVTPWLPVNRNFADGINVYVQEKKPDSILNFYRHLIKIRKQTSALVEGEYIPVHESSQAYLAFLRTTENQKVLVVLNFSQERLTIDFSDIHDHSLNHSLNHSLKPIFVSSSLRDLDLSKIEMEPFGILIARLSQSASEEDVL